MNRPLKMVIAAAEFPGHAFPEIALALALRARGHDVMLLTSRRWHGAVQGSGVRLLATEDATGVLDHGSFDGRLVEAARALLDRFDEFGADVVVSDVATAAPPLAAELAGIREATLIPTVYPVQGPALPPYPLGFVAARTPLGGPAWRALGPPLARVTGQRGWIAKVPGLLDRVRAELGLRPLGRGRAITSYGSISEGLVMVATFPQLEYPRPWPREVHVTGPMAFEVPAASVEIPPGDGPLVLVASSTAQDPDRALLRFALGALEGEAVRVVATMNRPGARWQEAIPGNAMVVDWLSYGQVMPQASVVVCSGGHGTVARSLAAGAPVVVSPDGGDMPEVGARAAWAGAGLMLPRRLRAPGPLRWAVRRTLAGGRLASRARELAAWARRNDGAERGAELVEAYASG